ADAVLLDRLGGIDRDLVVGLVALLHAKVVVEKIDVEIRMDQLVLDVVPDDPGHLVAVELDDRVGNLDLRHETGLWKRDCWEVRKGTGGGALVADPRPDGRRYSAPRGRTPPPLSGAPCAAPRQSRRGGRCGRHNGL